MKRATFCTAQGCCFSTDDVGWPRLVFPPEEQCFFCDPSRMRSPTLVATALAKLFIFDCSIYAQAFEIARTCFEEGRLKSMMKKALQTPPPVQVRALRPLFVAEALDVLLRDLRDFPIWVRQIKRDAQDLLATRMLCGGGLCVEVAGFLVHKPLVDLACTKKRAYTIARSPLFKEDLGCEIERLHARNYSNLVNFH